MKKFILIMLSLLIIFLSVINTNAVSKSSYKAYDNYCFYTDNSNSILVSYEDNKVIINTIGKGSITYNCSGTIRKSQYSDNAVHLFYENSDKKLCVSKYNLKNGKITDFKLDTNLKLDYNSASVSDSGYYYATDKIEKSKLYKFNTNGDFSETFDLDCSIMQSDTFNGKYIIVRTSGGLYYVNSNKVFNLSDKYFPRKIKMINDDSFICDGNIYRINKNVGEVYSYNNDKVAVIDSGFVYCKGKCVYYTPSQTSEARKIYSLDNIVNNIYGYGSKIYAITDKNIYTIKYSEFQIISVPAKHEEFNLYTDEEYTTKDTSPAIDINTNNENDTISYSISSDAYIFGDKYITEIMPSTSVTRFKNNINYDGYELNLYDGEYYVPSGNVYTGLTASFTGNGTINKTIIVKGDINCDGKLNNSDLDLMMSYNLDTASLGNLAKIAGNLNNDNKIDNKDLVAMAQMKK